MRKRSALLLMFLMILVSGCTARLDIPTDFPTSPPPARATPAPKLTLKTDVELEKQIAEIAKAAKGKVGVAAVLLETGDAAMLNVDQRFPMQSVYKLPIAMAVMEKVRLDELGLDEKIGVTNDDFVRPGMASALRDKNPNGGEFTIRELIQLSLVESDGTASDVLMRVAGGASEVQAYLTQIGITDMKVVNTEKEIGRDWETQYENWSTPMAALELLRWLDVAIGSEASTAGADDEYLESTPIGTIDTFLFESKPGQRRINGLLPTGTVVAHKTGTGGTRDGITGATNDIGIIYLSNGNHLAIAVFVSDSPADEKTRESVIAKISKAAWDKWSKE